MLGNFSKQDVTATLQFLEVITFLRLGISFWFFETGILCVALAVLELTL